MRLFDFMIEGSGDLAQRQMARNIYNAVVSHFSSGRALGDLKSFPKSSDDELIVALHGKKIFAKDRDVASMLSKLMFSFIGIEQREAPTIDRYSAGFDPQRGSKPPCIFVVSVIDVHPGEPGMSDMEWKYHVSSEGANIIKKNEDAMMHEIVHFLDSMRWKGSGEVHPTYDADHAGDDDSKRYFADPFEMNAYAQESLSSVENDLRRVKSREEAVIAMGGSPQELYKKVYNKKLAKFGDKVPDDTLRRLKKRTAQLWNDVLVKFSK